MPTVGPPYPQGMRRDSTATKARLLEAAVDEFAAYGIAGARVQRIAANAGVNKQLIYSYFGGKEQLFETALMGVLAEIAEAVPVDPDDLPAYVGQMFDYVLTHHDQMRLFFWDKLERPSPVAAFAQIEGFRVKLARIADAQREGRVDASLPAADLLAVLLGIATAWAGASAALHELSGNETPLQDALARHREVAVEAARRILAGPAAGR